MCLIIIEKYFYNHSQDLKNVTKSVKLIFSPVKWNDLTLHNVMFQYYIKLFQNLIYALNGKFFAFDERYEIYKMMIINVWDPFSTKKKPRAYIIKFPVCTIR